MKKLALICMLVSLAVPSFAAEKEKEKEKVIRNVIVVKDGEVLELGDGGEFFSGGKRAFLGVSMLDLTAGLREHFGASKEAGVLVSAVEDDSPAAKAGIRTGDVIVSIDGQPVDDSVDVRKALRDKKSGETVRIDVLRGRARQTLVATLVEREGAVRFMIPELGDLPRELGPMLARPEIRTLTNCGELQTRIKELETRLKDLEKRLK